MQNYNNILDISVCCLWAATYSLAFIGTIKYRFPLLSPVTQFIIAPLEFAVLIGLIINNNFHLNYVSISYLYWSIIEISLLILVAKLKNINVKSILIYLSLLSVFTYGMYYLVVIKDGMFYFNYFNTFVGELLWLKYINKDNYPMEPISLCVFVFKLIADTFAISVYFGEGPLIINTICLILPLLDFAFIVTYFEKRDGEQKT